MEASGQFQDPVALLPGKSSHPPRIGNGAGRSQSQSGRRESKSGGPAHILVTILIEPPHSTNVLNYYSWKYSVYNIVAPKIT